MIPNIDDVWLYVRSSELIVALSSPLVTSSTFAVLLSAETSDQFSVQQVISVQLNLTMDIVTEHIQVLLVSDTRRNTLIADMRSLAFYSREKDFTFDLRSNGGGSEYLFAVDSMSGRVLCTRDVRVDDDMVARDYSFNITASTTQQFEQTVATIDVLVLRDACPVSVDEGFVGTFIQIELRSDNFAITLNNAQPDIDFNNGSVSLTSPRDYQRDTIQTDLILAVRSVDDIIKTSIHVTMRVVDTNDKQPFFQEDTTEVYVIDGSSSGSVIAVVSATDPDTVGEVMYLLTGQFSGDFRVDSSGVVTALDTLRRTKFGEVFTLYVYANDGENESINRVTIHVTLYTIHQNIEKNLNRTFYVNVVEHVDIGTVVFNISKHVANYSDFKFFNPSSNIPFTLNSTSGLVTVVRDIDRESGLQYWRDNLEFGGYENFQDQCQPVRIGKLDFNIEDINDKKPTFSKSVYKGTIFEHSPVGSSVSGLLDLQAYDDDIGPNAFLNFTINDTDTFTLSNVDGRVIVKVKKDLDREMVPTYVVTIWVHDNPTTVDKQLTGSAIINIQVSDINDNSPTFMDPPSITNITENEDPRILTTLSASDKDEGRNAELLYNVYSGGFGFFQINETGTLFTTTAIDREMYSQFELTIRATDKGSPHKETDLTLTLFVNDVNDNAPQFDKNFVFFEIRENQDCSELNVTVLAVDSDSGTNGRVTYSLNDPTFSINSTTGSLSCKTPLDYEKKTGYELSVTASDTADIPKTSNMLIRIIILDVNDNTPVFSNIYQNEFLDKSQLENDSFILLVEVADADSGRNGQVNLTLSGPGSEKFTISQGNTGILKTAGVVPGAGNYSINITATDNGDPQRSNTTSVNFAIRENSGVGVQFERRNLDVPEQTCTGGAIGRVIAEKYGNQATYRLSSSDLGVFELDAATGNLTCNGELDREAKDEYLLLVNATNTGTGESHGILVIVRVTDVNDNDPKFVHGVDQVNSVPENAVNNTFIQKVSATDIDDSVNGTQGLQFSILNSNIPFAIDEDSGELTVRGELDRETKATYLIIIKVADGGSPAKSATANLTITLNDVNDNAPRFTSDVYTMNVYENVTSGSDLGVVSASDPDYDLNGTVTYNSTTVSVNPSEACPFSLRTETSGSEHHAVVNLIDQLDFETRATFTCVIVAVDASACSGGGLNACSYQLKSNSTLKINVLDNNDEIPHFQGTPYNASIARNATVGTLITSVNATDDDTDYGNNRISYRILEHEDFFHINLTTGVLTVKKALETFPLDTVRIVVEARDNPDMDQPLSASTTIELEIADTNKRPWFPNAPYSGDITEEEVNSDLLINMAATDELDGRDVICNCTYILVPRLHSDAFTISIKGILSQVLPIDREKTGNSLVLEVEAADRGTPRKTVRAAVTLAVRDINDNIPHFTQKTHPFSVKEPVPVGTIIGQVHADDADTGDNAESKFSAVGVDARISFHKDGTITAVKPLKTKNETVETIRFAVAVADEKDTVRSSINATVITVAEVLITVNPNDVNTAPKFQKDIYETKLRFLSERGTTVTLDNFKATDADGDDIRYRIASGNTRNILDMESDTGSMRLLHALESSIGSYINLTVEAVDITIHPKTGTCLVTITVVDPVPTECVSKSQLQVDSQQRETFLGLFIAMATLLAVAFVTTIFGCYKWRTTKTECEYYQSINVKDGHATKDQHEYDALNAFKRAQPNEYNSPVNQNFSNKAVHNPAYVSAAFKRDRQRWERPAEPPVDYEADVETPPQRRHFNGFPRQVPLATSYRNSGYQPTRRYNY